MMMSYFLFICLCTIINISYTPSVHFTEIRKEFEWVTLIRDGAFGPINAGSGLHDWNVRKRKKMYMLKTSGGGSMTENTNDLGWMHSILHKLFKSQDFKCKQYADPPGPFYSAAKKYLKNYLSPASFDTYWKAIKAMRPFMLKAFSPMAVLSALKLGGFDGKDINYHTILGHNLEFDNLPQEDADKVISLIPLFATYWGQNGLIYENIFDEVFAGDVNIDTLADRKGKPLNEMATNRQRFMMDNHRCWLEEMERRKDAERLEAGAKEARRVEREARNAAMPDKIRNCSMPNCPSFIDITGKNKKINELLWTHCPGKRCTMWGCQNHIEMVTEHIALCTKIVHQEE